ncbi:hypothetical protein C5167_032715 [Papaver somniferum]|uniref:MULE transposase domain-containing protein n=1 Tax=Papaver somniferum TaxID=3469 RepID=A0A4Y7K9T4_PAPSO|nr:hypothetical protein C5167_032715 [Papaver somniferum]
MELLVSHKAESSGSISSGIIAFDDQPQSSGIIPFEKPRIDYDVPDKIKESLKSSHWLHLFQGVEQLFPGGVEQVRCDLQKGYEYMVYRNEKLRIGARCANKNKEEKCDWHLYAVSVDGVVGSPFIIKELNNQHTCVGGFVNMPRISKKLVSSLIIDEIKQDPNKKTKHIMESFTRDFGFDISRYYAYACKKHALNTSWGENEKSFMFLNWYKNKLIETNPGSHVVLEVEEGTNNFQRMFICFEACSRGFNFCRPVLFVDAAHLKRKYLGHMMAATGLTGNDKIFPLAYGVVSSENEANWKWFLDNLKKVLSPLRSKLTFVSDRGIGLREKPIAIMVDEIRVKLMDQMCKRREDSANLMKWRQTLCPEYEALLHDNKMHGCNYQVTKSSEYVFEVHASLTQTVNLKRRTCSCNRWRIDVEKPVTVSPKSMVFGPNNGPQPGRPSKKKRIPNTGSVANKKMRTCGSCKVLTTHNKRTCPSRQIS